MASSSSSASAPTRGWTHDVFLSFRGEDTRNNIVDHLYAALIQKGIRVFKDDKMLGGGQPISQELVKAIQESKFAVVVLSKNYANSSWCLDELVKIMECQHQMGQRVLPVFYHVDPSDVRGQKRDFATAFEQHEEKFKGEMDIVKKWREALAAAANLSGCHISTTSGGEYAIIKKIVQEILGGIQPRGRDNNLIGMESRIHALNSLLNMEAMEEVRIIGIHGMRGIGKTTLARALFKRIAYKFEGSCFVNDVREKSCTKKDTCALQEKILRDILVERHEVNIEDPEYGADMIQERLCNKKVLLVLDDVDNGKQLEFLAATHEWFGPGSRIVITTRDEHLLSDANDKYKPALLSMDQAVELFSRHAFRKNSPPDEYKELSNRAIRYTDRLPLALKVLGSFFHGRQPGVWESALNRLSKTPNSEIFDTLKLSFDDLNVYEQNIFLDIACFFKGKDKEDVTRVLDSFGFYPGIGISSLVEKSLITVTRVSIEMHDLIQEMGRKIVRESAPNSRLWKKEEAYDFINRNRELEVIEAIVLPWEDSYDQEQNLNADVLESMTNLRLLHVSKNFTSREPTFLPNELQWLRWYHYPFPFLPVAEMRKLVGLEMIGSRLEHLWKGKQIMMNLKFINLECSHCLTSFPDVSGAPNLERLILSFCYKLEEVDESVGFLKRLVYLDMSKCWKLKRLPSRFEMESLETLNLSNCWSVERLPEFSRSMVKLSHIDLTNCFNIQELPNSICEFNSNLCFLKKLDLSGIDIEDKDFPINLYAFSALEELNLSRNSKLTQLPASISNLSSLKQLKVNGCSKLRNLHGLPSGIQVLKANNCESLEKIEDLSEKYEWLYNIHLHGCKKLLEDEENERYIDKMLSQSFLMKWAAVDGCLNITLPSYKIPSWFKEQQDGNEIALKLPPNWQTQIMGFALCRGFRQSTENYCPGIEFKFQNDGMGVPMRENGCIAHVEIENVWIGYVPFNLFEQVRAEADHFKSQDWYHIIEGNLVIAVDEDIERCGGKVVYKEDVESIQHIQPSFSSSPSSSCFSYYRNWVLECTHQNTVMWTEKNYVNLD